MLAVGDLFADALRDQDSTFRTTVSVGLWVVWAAIVITLVIPGAGALVLARTVVPAAVPATLWAFYAVGDGRTTIHITTIGVAAIAGLAVLAPRVGEQFIDAASYGDERRHLLRPPAPVQAMLIPTWAVAVVGLAAGPLALAAERWVLGVALTITGGPLALVAVRAFLRLAQRWLVFVPAGLVIHDHVAVSEPVLVPKAAIRVVGPARADTTATDLTANATGLALEFQLRTPLQVALPVGQNTAEDRSVERFLLAPTRPAVVMAEASTRRISIG